MSKSKLPAIVWTILIVVGCWIPSNRLAVDETATSLLRVPNLDKLAHLFLFGLFGALWTRAFPRGRTRFALVMAAGLALAIVTEVGQGTRYVRREADLLDAVADTLGTALGIAAWIGLEKSRLGFTKDSPTFRRFGKPSRR